MPPSAGPGGRRGAGGRASRVTRTGIALVHEGELVLPAAGSEAAAEAVAADQRATIHYYFPVEIEVRAGESSAAEMRAAVDDALRSFARGVLNRG